MCVSSGVLGGTFLPWLLFCDWCDIQVEMIMNRLALCILKTVPASFQMVVLKSYTLSLILQQYGNFKHTWYINGEIVNILYKPYVLAWKRDKASVKLL